MSTVEDTPLKAIPDMVSGLRTRFNSGISRSYDFRAMQLRQLILMLKENHKAFADALRADLSTIPLFVHSEITGSAKEAELLLENLSTWMAPSSASIPLSSKPGSGYVRKEPFGVALIISPWNYPLSLLLKPLAGALAAGNLVLLKPSEVSAHCAAALAKLLPRYLPDSVAVVSGGVPQSTAVLAQRFDVIMYTGGTEVGKVVMRAAAEHLTPVILELGGKSPCIVDRSADLTVAARRIAWGKFVCNVGQTCVSPDYVLVEREVEEEFVRRLLTAMREFFGPDPRQSSDYSRIIHARHVSRLNRLLEPVRSHVATGGESEEATRYFAPTVLRNVPMGSAVMQEEIFGPILPVQAVTNVEEAVRIVNEKERPLALYLFTRDSKNKEFVLGSTISGGVGVNEVVMHVACPGLPFGGVGASGMGNYNGKYSFDAFSHQRAVLERPFYLDSSMRYPPYTEAGVKRLLWLMSLKLPSLRWLVTLLAVPIAGFLLYSKL